jgi:hypothetical protein
VCGVEWVWEWVTGRVCGDCFYLFAGSGCRGGGGFDLGGASGSCRPRREEAAYLNWWGRVFCSRGSCSLLFWWLGVDGRGGEGFGWMGGCFDPMCLGMRDFSGGVVGGTRTGGRFVCVSYGVRAGLWGGCYENGVGKNLKNCNPETRVNDRVGLGGGLGLVGGHPSSFSRTRMSASLVPNPVR